MATGIRYLSHDSGIERRNPDRRKPWTPIAGIVVGFGFATVFFGAIALAIGVIG